MMKISVIAYLCCIILCAQLLISSDADETKLPSLSTERVLDLKSLVSYQEVHAKGATINSKLEIGNARESVVNNAIVSSKKSQGNKGSGGGANVVRQPHNVKSNAESRVQVLSFYISACISFTLILVISL